jgi:tetratricopeptide (TPR) repeat protein
MENITNTDIVLNGPKINANLSARVSSLALASIPEQTQSLLLRMFADPYILEKDQRSSLVAQLRDCVTHHPEVSELRVLLGMALCVNLDAQAAIEELRESVRLAPNSFIAHLKLGELWMRLRVVDKAEEHTRLAALLSQSLAQSELARRQATTLRTMKREGIERGGYKSPFGKVTHLFRRISTRRRSETSVALDLS